MSRYDGYLFLKCFIVIQLNNSRLAVKHLDLSVITDAVHRNARDEERAIEASYSAPPFVPGANIPRQEMLRRGGMEG